MPKRHLFFFGHKLQYQDVEYQRDLQVKVRDVTYEGKEYPFAIVDLGSELVQLGHFVIRKLGMTVKEKPVVVVESPYAGADIEKNRAYLARAFQDCFRREETPMASHALYAFSGLLDDSKPEERELGITSGLVLMGRADYVAVYTDLGISKGMQQGIDRARTLGLAVDYRRLRG